MKRLVLPVFMVVMAVFLFSCAKPATTPANNSPTASMAATVSGTAWTAKTVTANANAVVLTITGTSSDGSYIQMTMPPTVTANTYSFSQSGDYTFQYNNTVTNFLVNVGTLKITSYAKNVMVGTFTASVTGGPTTETISNGTFTAIFQ